MSPPRVETWSRTTPPTRAVPSSLSSRSAPTISPATEGYQPLAKRVLRDRLAQHIFPYSFTFALGLTVLGRLWIAGLGSALAPQTLLWAALRWAGGAWPIIMMRKAYLTAIPAAAQSRSHMFHQALAERRTWVTFGISLASASFLASLHLFYGYAYESDDTRINVFVKSKQHPYYLNARFVVLVWSQIVLASAFLVRNVILDRFAFKWKDLTLKEPYFILPLFRTLYTSIIAASLAVPLTIFLLHLARLVVLPVLYEVPLFPFLLRPVFAHMLLGRGLTVGWTKVWLLSAGTFALWEWTEVAFQVYVHRPVFVKPQTPVSLISGAVCPPPGAEAQTYFQYLAYSEILNLASSTSEQSRAAREAIFSDQKYVPGMWQVFVRESLLRLGKDYKAMLGREMWKPSPPPAPIDQSRPPDEAKERPVPGTPIRLIRQPVMRSTPPTPLSAIADALAASGPVSHAAVAEVRAPEAVDGGGAQRVVPATGATSAARGSGGGGNASAFLVRTLAQVRQWTSWGVFGAFWTQLDEKLHRWNRWWRTERPSKALESRLPFRDLDALVVDTLSHMICASLSEDKFGVVQRDIPRVLEAFLLFYHAILDKKNEIRRTYEQACEAQKPVVDDWTDEAYRQVFELGVETERSLEVLNVVDDALHAGIWRVVQAFGPRLTAFKFPPWVAKKLQAFANQYEG